MIKFWKTKKNLNSSRQEGSLSEREIQERIYGRYIGKKKDFPRESDKEAETGPKKSEEDKSIPKETKPLRETKPSEPVLDKTQEQQGPLPAGARKVKGPLTDKIDEQPDWKQQFEEQKVYIQQLRSEKDSLVREVAYLKKKYLELGKQKSALDEKVARLQTEESKIKKEHTFFRIGQLRGKVSKIFSSIYRRFGVQKLILTGVGILILIIAVSGVWLVISQRSTIPPDFYRQINLGQDRQADIEGERESPSVREPVNADRTRGRKPFTIQVYVSRRKSDAETVLNRLRSKGYDADIVELPSPSGNIHYRIYIGHFSNSGQAETILERIKKEEEFKDSFIRRR